MKNLLAIDTSTEQLSVALLVDGLLYSDEQSGQKTQAQVILPVIEALMNKANSHVSQLDGIVFGRGPGSFTGLRIACSIAKGLALAHDIPLIPVSSLATIAWLARQQVPNTHVLSLLDARMNEVYWGYFSDLSYETAEQVTKAGDIRLNLSAPIVLAGHGIDAYWSDLPEAMKMHISLRIDLVPQATAMIDMVNALECMPVTMEKAQPFYVRNQVTQGDSRG